MERGKPWHPFRVPGMCGLKHTTFLLTLLSILLCSLILWMTEELLTADAVQTNQTLLIVINDTTNYAANDTILQRPKRNAMVRVTMVQGPEGDIISMMEGDSVKFECNPFKRNCETCRGRQFSDAQYGPVYICQDPCGWGEVKAYTYPPEYGTDNRFKVSKKNVFGNNREGMVIELRDVRTTDSGKYYCGIDKEGKDWYEAFNMEVNKPATKIPAIKIDAPSWDESAWMGSNAAEKETEKGAGKMKPEVQKAMMKCQGNKACTLALLQKQELEINTSCWLCLQMSHAWKAVPLTVDAMNETDCLIPRQMTEVLRAARDIEHGKIPTKHQASACESIKQYNHSDMLIPPLRVTHTQGDVCVCSKGLTKSVKTGWSECRIRIEMNTELTENCTATIDGNTTNFTCPFSKPKDTSPAAVWVCGDRAYHFMPNREWEGCCYPALMNVGTSVYLPGEEHEERDRQKRDVKSVVDSLPHRYNGYVLSDPWTTPGANIGWSIFLGVGTAVTINKINGLAWTVLAIANSTEHALDMVNEEMKQIRDAVIQNRLVLDMLTAEKGGVCKMLGLSCCFHIPDYSDNITSVITHMRLAVREPEKADDSWFAWLTDLRGWGSWLGFTVLPILAIIVLILLCLPCIIPCITGLVHRIATATMAPQMLSMSVYDEYDAYNDYDEWLDELGETTKV